MYTLYSLDESFGARPLNTFSGRAVERWSEAHPSWLGLTPAYIGHLVAVWMATAGVKARPGDGRGAHALRHSCLTEVAQSTPDPWVLAELAGWSSINTAAYYVRRASTERVRAALEAR